MTMIREHFMKGINLGGWFAQADCLGDNSPRNRVEMETHLQTYITEYDIRQIREWGYDHIRLPFDYRLVEQEKDSLASCDMFIHHLDQCVEWCRANNMGIVLDLHQAAGNVYGMTKKPMPLLTDEDLQNRFINIWIKLTEHFKKVSEPIIIFELLNEVSDSTGFLWNRLYLKTIGKIREVDTTRYILVGSNEQNSAFRLKELDLLEDPKVIYNFHFYDPMMFTHQKAHFSEDMLLYNKNISYPGEITGFPEYLEQHREYVTKFAHVVMENKVNKESMEKLLAGALNFVKYSGKELYCGEFGVIDTVKSQDAVGWMKDLVSILNENGIGHAMWNYKEMDFGLVKLNGEIRDEKRLNMIRLVLQDKGEDA